MPEIHYCINNRFLSLFPYSIIPIVQTRNFVSEEIIRMEPDEGLEKLRDALKICSLFKSLYFEKKSQLSSYFKELPVVEWNFKSSLVFTRMDMFTNQMKLIEVK